MTSQSVARRVPMAGLALAVALLYAFTAARTVVFIDSGELSTVAWTLGIPHPTGYPLFTVLAWLAAHFPADIAPVFKLNLFSAACSAAGVLLFALMVRWILGRHRMPAGRPAGTKGAPGGGLPAAGEEVTVLASALFGALTLAFSETYWAQSASVEVYPLHGLFLVVLIWLFLSAFPRRVGKAKSEGPERPATAHLFAYVLGLSFTNHMSTIYLAPAFLVLYFMRRGGGGGSRALLLSLGPAFILGLSAYLYLPVRASGGPLMNWGNPVDAESILRHLGGKQYSVWIFSSTETASRQLSYFFRTLGAEFSWAPLALALWGLRFLYRRERDLFVMIALLFAGCLLFAVNYDINDIESYFLLAYLATALAASAGLYAILTALNGRRRLALLALSGIFLGWQAVRTYPAADQSAVRVVEQYARSILASADPGGIVISYQWDYFVSATYYLQVVEGFRPDVIVVDKELLRRSWYIGYLRNRYPALLEGLGTESEALLAELRKFERGLPYDPRTIESRYAGLIAGMISRHYSARSVYVTAEIEPQYTPGYVRVPHGLSFRLRREGDADLWRDVPVVIDPPSRTDRYTDGITGLAARAELGTALYLERRGMLPDAIRAAGRALAIRPDFPEARTLLGRLAP